MRLERIKCKHLVHAWDITVSDSYIIACTGRRALVLDRQYQLLQSFDGLDYVYAADVSPDEKKLLLISNGNKFYVADLESGQKQRVTLRTPYNYNLEGRGCWSFDGGSMFVLAMNSKTLNSALRCYRADDLSQYEDFLAETYQLTQIHRLRDGKTYLLIGTRRSDGVICFIYFDGTSFTQRVLMDSESLIVFHSEVDPESGNVTLYTSTDCCRYTAEGERIGILHHPSALVEKVSFSEVFSKMYADAPEKMEDVRQMCTDLGLENAESRDLINKYAYSPCRRYHYVASKSGFYVADAQTAEVLAHVPEEYGVQNFHQVAADMIALSTWGGVKLYRFVED